MRKLAREAEQNIWRSSRPELRSKSLKRRTRRDRHDGAMTGALHSGNGRTAEGSVEPRLSAMTSSQSASSTASKGC